MRVAVIGGGLAGITAALALAEAGEDVTLLEAKPRLGGATMSFERGHLVVDTGQHVFLRCCTAYRGLLDRLGMTSSAPIQPRFDVTILSPPTSPRTTQLTPPTSHRRRRTRLRRSRLPAPLHLLPALAGYPLISLSERARVGQAVLAMRKVDPSAEATDQVSFGDWLARHGQDERTRRALWDLFSVASINVPGDDASLALAAKVVQTGLLGDAGAADIGVPALPLGEIHGTAAARKLAEHHATVRLSTKVTAIDVREANDGGEVMEASGTDGAAHRSPFIVRLGRGADEDVPVDAVVLAVPHETAARLIPPGALPAGTVDGWAVLGAAPIVNVHVIYDRKVMDVPFAAGVDSPVQWVFDRTRISGMHARGEVGQYLAISLSAADEYVDRSVASLREEMVPALADLLPAAGEATVTEFFVTRERRATFRGLPGTARLRPAAATGLPGLVLAGSWTATGWPDTMEGAVRSGLNAVMALRAGAGTDAGVTRGAATGTASASAAVTNGNKMNNSTVNTADSARGVRS
ncbi:MAG: squalene-associated FAD-dependent desaturase [Actinomycetia bacterium]|nr:squalene-associated FAD-dependent desaturase [Actinomycetes bacterium]